MHNDTDAAPNERLAELLRQYPDHLQALPKELLAGAQRIRLEKDQFAFRCGDRCTAYLLLLQGEVRVQLISDEGREVTLYRIGPGNSCVLTTSCLLSHEDYPAEAIAETDLEALAVSTTAFRQALEQDPQFRTYVFDGFSQRLSSVIAKIAELSFTSIDARLARALLRFDRQGIHEMTHHELGVELGTAREVVSRHLKRFERNGWVRLGRGEVFVLDRRQLEALCNPSLGD